MRKNLFRSGLASLVIGLTWLSPAEASAAEEEFCLAGGPGTESCEYSTTILEFTYSCSITCREPKYACCNGFVCSCK
jgi:hypothetical protein